MIRAFPGLFLLLGPIIALITAAAIGIPPTTRFEADGLPFTFDYPSGWTVNPTPVYGFGGPALQVEVGNFPWPQCAVSNADCQSQPRTYGPGQIAVRVNAESRHPDFCFSAVQLAANPRADRETRYYRVDGFPAIYEREVVEADPGLIWDAHEIQRWSIESPEIVHGTDRLLPMFFITATLRDPATPGFRLMLDQLVASFHMHGDLLPENDCGAPFPPLG